MFLAGKLSNCFIKLDRIVEFLTKRNKEQYGTRQSSEKLKDGWRNSILLHEELLLGQLRYELDIEIPEKFLRRIFKKVNVDPDEELALWTRAIVNDTFYSDFCTRYDPFDIAVAAIATASFYLDKPFTDEMQREIRVQPYKIQGYFVLIEISKRIQEMYKKTTEFADI